MGKDLSSLPVGTVLKGKYRIKSHLSSGGFGKTYLAEYGSRNTKVAIKEFFMNTANQREADGVTVSVDRTKENADAFDSQLVKFKKEYERLKQINNHERLKDCIVLNFRLLINQNAKNDIAGTAILFKCRMSTFLSPCCTTPPATASSALAVPTKSPYAERGYDWHPKMP